MLILYDKKERQFLSNGIGRLDKYAFDDKVREELNGIYKLEFTYPIHAKYSKDIKHENIIRATVPDGEQPFFISRIVKKNGYLKVTAYHIFYLLIWQLIEDINIVNLSGQAALSRVLENTEFTGLSDISETKSIRIVRYNAVEAILDKGQDNTLISRFGGELKRDKLNVQLMNRIGRRYENYPSEIRYAKNLLSYEADIDGNNANRIMPIGFDGLLLPEKYVVKPGTDPADYKTLKVEYTSVKAISNPESQKEGELPLEEAYEALRQAVLSDFENGRFDLKANYQIQFQELSMTEEYKNKAVLEKMYIGDEVKVIHTDEDLEVLSRIIAYEWSPIRKEYDEVEMGNHVDTFSDIRPTLELIAGKIEQYKTDWENNVEEITELLTTALGGHVLKRTGEILIMDTEDPETAMKIWRWNLNGLGYSGTGINGPYETAITMDGRIIAKFIYALNLSSISADLGTVTAGRIQDKDNESYWDLDNKIINLNVTSLKIQSKGVPTEEDLENISVGARNMLPLKESFWLRGTIGSSDGLPGSHTTRIYLNGFIDIGVAKEITVSRTPETDGEALIYEYDSSYNYLGALISDLWILTYPMTLPLRLNTKYLRFVIRKEGSSTITQTYINSVKIKVEKGNKVTDFTKAIEDNDATIATIENKLGEVEIAVGNYEDGKLYGTTYTFTGNSFNIGGMTGDVAEHNNAESKYKHADGSYTKIGTNGLERVIGGSTKKYHYLISRGAVYDSFNPSTNTIEYTRTITLPSDFKNKDYTIALSLRTYGTEDQYGYRTTDYAITAQELTYGVLDFAAGTFQFNARFVVKRIDSVVPVVPYDVGFTVEYLAVA